MSDTQPTYTILTTDYGQAFQCLRCGLISYNENDVNHHYCGACKLFHNDQPLPPLTLSEFQAIYNRLYRFLTAEQTMRKRVFPPGSPRRQDKLTASALALADLQILKDLIKRQFQMTLPETQQPTQPPLLDLPPSQPNYV